MTWEKGRQLKTFDDISYEYNANGIRTAKTVGGVRHEYDLEGSNILRESDALGNVIVPLYDGEEQVCGMTYNGELFFFHKNLQGDIIAITDHTAAFDPYGYWVLTIGISWGIAVVLGVNFFATLLIDSSWDYEVFIGATMLYGFVDKGLSGSLGIYWRFKKINEDFVVLFVYKNFCWRVVSLKCK